MRFLSFGRQTTVDPLANHVGLYMKASSNSETSGDIWKVDMSIRFSQNAEFPVMHYYSSPCDLRRLYLTIPCIL